MWEVIKSTLIGFVSSKKAVVTVAGVLGSLFALIGLKDIPVVITGDTEVSLAVLVAAVIVGLVGSYLKAQGTADDGKEAAKIYAAEKPIDHKKEEGKKEGERTGEKEEMGKGGE